MGIGEHHIGNIYKLNERDYYILSQVSCRKVTLIGLSHGNRWSEPILVTNVFDITDDEMKKIKSRANIKRVEHKIILRGKTDGCM